MPKSGRTYGQDILKGEYNGISGEGLGKRFRHSNAETRAAKAATPGGGTGPNSAYLFKTEEGYKKGAEAQASGAGTSIFDPVLCELAYAWWCPPGGLVLDPFAGGSVRGIVAAMMRRRYRGIDLSERQIQANRAQAADILDDSALAACEWIVGDASDLSCPDPADFIFTCPPYFDLERYSDDPRDLSNMDPPAFLAAYREIIRKASARLRDNRFACIVVGDVRAPDGAYRNLPGETIAAFQAAGLALYNEAILVTAAGSLPIRAGRQFELSRKLGKTHQNVFCFVKGSAAEATKVIGKCEFGRELEPGADELDDLDS